MAAPSMLSAKPRLRDWEREDKLNVELVGYGGRDKRVTVHCHLPKTRDPGRVQTGLLFLGRDVKHSRNWTCEYCSAPSRETHVQTFSWQHLDPPRLVVYVHYVCDMDEPHVREGIRLTNMMFNGMNLSLFGGCPEMIPEKEPGTVFALAGSCAHCQRDETAMDSSKLKKCSKCRLTRYCSLDCQKQDWRRHKVSCADIFSVNFENWE